MILATRGALVAAHMIQEAEAEAEVEVAAAAIVAEARGLFSVCYKEIEIV